MWKNHCKGFAIQRGQCEWEGKCLIYVGIYHKIPSRLIYDAKDVIEGWVPSGTVQWVSKIIGENIIPDYFPNFLSRWITRKVWRDNKWPGKNIFLKPADKYKRFDGFITDEMSKRKKGPFWCSEIVNFQNEWRWYIAYGEVIGAYWYKGILDEPVEAPTLDITWPKNWCGAVDFGILENGKIELIESHHPFACGWYGKKHEEYAKFLTLGWKWIQDNRHKESF